jgi:hypothetical protein
MGVWIGMGGRGEGGRLCTFFLLFIFRAGRGGGGGRKRGEMKRGGGSVGIGIGTGTAERVNWGGSWREGQSWGVELAIEEHDWECGLEVGRE